MARKTSSEQPGQGVPSGFKEPAVGPWERVVTWVKENSTSVILPILAIIILGAGIYYYSTGPTLTTPPAQDLNATATTGAPAADAGQAASTTANEPAPTTEAAPAETTIEVLTETAGKGDGITHLARRALKTFLASHQEYSTLTKEHKIFIEDYLKDQVGSRLLEVGETLQFSTTQIQNAIAQAERLTPAQLQNLTKYAQRVLVL